MARVELTSDAREDLRDLDGSARRLVLKALKKLETDPMLRGEPLGANVKGNLTGFRKLVVGNRDYRIVYRVEDAGDVTVVWVIARRADDEVYEMAVARLQVCSDPQIVNGLAGLLDDAFQRRQGG